MSPALSALCLLSLEGQAPRFQRLKPCVFPVEELWPHSVCNQWLTLLFWLNATYWMSPISPSVLRPEGRSHSWHFSAIFALLVNCCNGIQTLSGMTQWQMILPWSRGTNDPSRSLSGSVGGFDGSVAGSILVKWCFFSGQSTGYGKNLYIQRNFLLVCFSLLYCPS